MRAAALNAKALLRSAAPAFAPGLALGTALLLPAWGAALSLRAAELSLSAWLQLLALTALCATLGALVVRLSSPARWLPALALVVATLALAPDTGQYLAQTVRLALISLPWLDEHRSSLRLVLVGLALAAVPAAYHWRRHALALLRAGLGATVGTLCVLAAVLALQYLVRLSLGGPSGAAPSLASVDTSRPVVVVLVFDELDSQMLAEQAASLPGFEQLARRSRIWGDVFPPANYTHISVPAMLTGQPLVGAEVGGGAVVMATADGRRSLLGRGPDLLSQAAAMGRSVSVVGWHLPYCAVWPALPRCLDDAAFGVPGAEVGVVPWMLARSTLLWHWRRGGAEGAIHDVDEFAARFFGDRRNLKSPRFPQLYRRLAERTLADATGGHYDLVFAHLPCPHLPRLDGGGTQGMKADYHANLAVCDRLLGDLLRTAKAPGQRPLRLLVTSDHWFRGLDWIAHQHAGRRPAAPRPVPLWVLDEVPAPARVQLATGSNVGLLPLALHLLNAPALDNELMRRAMTAHGPAQTWLDRF